MELASVVFEQDSAVDARKYGDVIAPILGITRLEAKIVVRRARGMFLEDIPETDAQVVVDHLSRDGVRARVVRNEQLPLLSPPRKLGIFERGAAVLRWRAQGEHPAGEIGWGQIDVVSLGCVTLPGFRDSLSNVNFDVPAMHRLGNEPGVRELIRENLILKMGAAKEKKDAPKKHAGASAGDSFFDVLQAQYAGKLEVYCDLVDVTHTQWIRVEMGKMAYAHDEHSVKLGEAWGFHLLVHDLQAFSGGAFTPVALKFAPDADIKELTFQQLEDLNRYTTWNVVCRHLGINTCASADSSSPSPEPPAPATGDGS